MAVLSSSSSAAPPDQLTLLGGTHRGPVDHVECYPAPEGITTVRFRSEELCSVCPVTLQPDLASFVIEYEPDRWCIESKSLKLFLWGFRDRAIFAEALAVEIAQEVMRSAVPHRVRVVLTQRHRGGIGLEATAELPLNEAFVRATPEGPERVEGA